MFYSDAKLYMQERKKGWKCFDCIGTKSTNWEELRIIHNNDEQNINNQIKFVNVSYIDIDITGKNDLIDDSTVITSSQSMRAMKYDSSFLNDLNDTNRSNSSSANNSSSKLSRGKSLKNIVNQVANKRQSLTTSNSKKLEKKTNKIKKRNSGDITATNVSNNPILRSQNEQVKALKNSPLASVLNLENDKNLMAAATNTNKNININDEKMNNTNSKEKKGKNRFASLKRHKFTIG